MSDNQDPSGNVLVSIIIPTLNSEKTIDRLLDSIVDQEPHEKEILIVDGGSVDKTLTVAGRYPVEVFYERKRGIGAARRTGVLKASGRYVAFIDSDCRAPSNWLSDLTDEIRKASSDRVAGVGGRAIPEEQSLISKCLEYRLFTSRSVSGKVESIATFNAIYLREIILEAGNFDPELEMGEDLELNHRIRQRGFDLIYAPHIYVYHSHPHRLQSLLSKWFHYGRWFAQVSVISKSFQRKILPRLFYLLLLVTSFLGVLRGMGYLPVLLFLLPSVAYLNTARRAFRETNSLKLFLFFPFVHTMKTQAHNAGILYYFISGLPRRVKKDWTK